MIYRAAAPLLALLIVTVWLTGVSANGKEPPKSIDSLAAIIPDSIDIHGKVVYIDFWASWCLPCRKSFPFMQHLNRDHADDGFVVLAINLDKDSSAAAAFLAKNPAPFSVVYDPEGLVAQKFDLKAIPTSFVYGRDGLLRETHKGFEPSDTTALKTVVESLLKEKPAE